MTSSQIKVQLWLSKWRYAHEMQK